VTGPTSPAKTTKKLVLIVSYLSQQFLPRLADAVREIGADHVHASSWEEVQELVRRKPVNVLVLDPYADRASRADDIVMLLQQFPSTPIIVYTEFTPPALRVLTFLAQYGLQETLLFQIDDDCARLGRLLTRLSTLPLVLRLLHELRHESSQLLPPLAGAVDDLFKRPHAYTSGQDLVLVSHTPLTSLYRALMDAGFAPPKQLFMAARVLHAAVYIRDPGSTVQQVAEKIGYQHPRVLTQHTMAVLGRRPSALRNTSDDEVLPLVLHWTRLKDEKQVAATLPISGVEPPLQEIPSNLQLPITTAAYQDVMPSSFDPVLAWAALVGYGRSLEQESRWPLAAYTYYFMIAVLGVSADCADPALTAIILTRLGVVLRYLGAFEESHQVYRHAQAMAEQVGALELVLRSRVGMANTLMAQGNLGEADASLSHVIADASNAGIVAAEALARHCRGSVRLHRRRHVDAMFDFFKAYQLTTEPSDRELVLGDLAACAGDAGYRTLARDIYRTLLRRTRQPVMQSAALGTLLEFAVYEGDVDEFKRLQTQIAIQAQKYPPPVAHTTRIALYGAYGVERFDNNREAAIAAYNTVITESRRLGAHQVAFLAEERLTALLAGAVSPISPPIHEPPDSLRDVVNAIAEWTTPGPPTVPNTI